MAPIDFNRKFESTALVNAFDQQFRFAVAIDPSNSSMIQIAQPKSYNKSFIIKVSFCSRAPALDELERFN